MSAVQKWVGGSMILKKQSGRYKMKKHFLPVLLIAAVFVLFASCEKKQTTAEKYAESVKTASNAYADVIEQTSEVYSDAVKSVSSDLTNAANTVLTDTANTVAGLASTLGSATSSTANTEWKKAMDEYEKFVNDYVRFMKKYKANPTDMSLLTQYTSMTQKVTTFADSITKIQGNLSGSDLAAFTTRYTKIAAKLASAL
jgi:uncharacterized protein YktB (UPF0637 family)